MWVGFKPGPDRPVAEVPHGRRAGSVQLPGGTEEVRRIERLGEHVEAVAGRAQHKARGRVGRLIEMGQRRSDAELVDEASGYGHEIVEGGMQSRPTR